MKCLIRKIWKQPIIDDLFMIVPLCNRRALLQDLFYPSFSIVSKKNILWIWRIFPPLKLRMKGFFLRRRSWECLRKNESSIFNSSHYAIKPFSGLFPVIWGIIQTGGFDDSYSMVIKINVKFLGTPFFSDTTACFFWFMDKLLKIYDGSHFFSPF